MNSSPGNLSKRQLNAITTILSCRTISEGVSRAGISRGTFYKWMQDPMFRGELDKQRKEVIALALQDIKASAGDAVKVLRGLLKAKNESIRLKASTEPTSAWSLRRPQRSKAPSAVCCRVLWFAMAGSPHSPRHRRPGRKPSSARCPP